MISTLSVPIELVVDVHEVEGGGFWGEVRQMRGCVAQAGTLEDLRAAMALAIRDWLAEPGLKTEQSARELAAIQGVDEIPEGPYPLDYGYRPPASWTEADEDE
jgi:predicted RNase H-like HicB family nuclease